MTDGHVIMNKQGNIAILTSKDKDWLESIRDLICPEKQITRRLENAFSLDLSNKIICLWLVQNGCIPRKSLIIKYPNIPEEYACDFIRGCFDGDGCICIYNAKNRIRPRKYSYLASASKEFIISMSEKLNYLGIKNSVHQLKLSNSIINGRKIIAKHPLFKVHISDLQTYKLCRLIYYPDCLCLERKHKISNLICQMYPPSARLVGCPMGE